MTKRFLPADERERDDREHDHDDEELGAAALVRGRVLADLVDGRADRPPRGRGSSCARRRGTGRRGGCPAPARSARGSRGRSRPGRGPRRRAGPSPFSTPAVVDRGDEQRQQEEDRRSPTPSVITSISDDRALAELDALLLGLDVGAADEPARADDQRLVQDDEAAHERPLRRARAVEPGVEASRSRRRCAVGWRRATAIASRPRIRTPSMRAWPP